MITAGDFRKGITIEWDGGVWNIVDFQHVKPGKGAAFLCTKIKNVMTGTVVGAHLQPHRQRCPGPSSSPKHMQYLYNDGSLYYFMDPDTFEQMPFNQEQVEGSGSVREGKHQCHHRAFQRYRLLGGGPNFVDLEITETEPGFKGDTTSNTYKPLHHRNRLHPDGAAVYQHRGRHRYRHPHR